MYEQVKFKYPWRPYQQRVLEEFDKYIFDKKINVVAAPGSGKTVLGLEIARRLDKPVLILSPTITIKNQWIDRFINLFMDSDIEKPDWISSNVYNLKSFNSVTYQGLHCAYKKIKQRNITETDDKVEEEKFNVDVDIKEYNLIAEIKKNKIGTVILDEAHHLKSEWWQSLTKVIESIGDVTLVSLTATPPYDVEYAEWKRYSNLCGEIDVEISVPELVAEKNLCPHQDYIFYSYPTEKEKNSIREYIGNVKEFVTYLKNNVNFINALILHPFLKYTDRYIEEILDNPQYYSSILIFLKECNIEVSKDKIEVLGHSGLVPSFTTTWLEILLQNLLYSDSVKIDDVILKEIEVKLNRIGAIDKKKILLTDNPNISKYFLNSLSKLESINKIVKSESANLKNELRMVILTDYLRKECIEEENVEINKIGVFPIFLNLLKQNINENMAILTGSTFVIPKSQSEELIELLSKEGIQAEKIKFNEIKNFNNYCIVDCPNKDRNAVMSCISKLFSEGNINIIIGTKSLLGEGWDEPSINSLILASFVGSYVLSNQMRGRAIRTNDNPNKTANVWHLVCATDFEQEYLRNSDYLMLKRRFKSFVGIGYVGNVLESGIERLDVKPQSFSRKEIDRYNEKILQISNNREEMYNRWFKLINQYGGSKIKINDQVKVKKQLLKNKFYIIQPKRMLLLFLSCVVVESMSNIVANSFEKYVMILALGVLLTVLINIKFILQCIKAMRLIIPKNKLQSVVKVVVKSLCEQRIIKTDFDKIKINIQQEKADIGVNLSVVGVTPHENAIIINSLEDIFSRVESQRYIIVNNKERVTAYYNVPNILSTNKELAETFSRNWQKYIGISKLVYTRSIEGRKILIKARKNTFDYTDTDGLTKKKKTISKWN